MSIKLLPYNAGSASSRNLAEALRVRGIGIKRLKLERSTYRPSTGDIIINWGSATSTAYALEDSRATVINSPTAVEIAGNKLLTFDSLSGGDVPIPEYTTSRGIAMAWCDDGAAVVVRHQLRGHSGAGIQIVTDAAAIPDAPLYTKYLKKSQEYRVHVLGGQVIDTQRKMRRTDVPDAHVNWQVRNFASGFTYGREDVAHVPVRDNIALSSVAALGLHFGAVDIIYNRAYNQYTVLEINTAPGLQGTTLEIYADAFASYLNGVR